jgi:hypothetical protein
MNPDLKAKWDEAARTGEPVPIGDSVLCDICDLDYTHRPDQGGFITGSYAYCPTCAKEKIHAFYDLGEEHLIRAWAGPGESFANFVRRMRGPDAFIRIHRG